MYHVLITSGKKGLFVPKWKCEGADHFVIIAARIKLDCVLNYKYLLGVIKIFHTWRVRKNPYVCLFNFIGGIRGIQEQSITFCKCKENIRIFCTNQCLAPKITT